MFQRRSSVNQIMILSTTLTLAAGRFGLAPTSTRNASAGLKLSENKAAGLFSNDPAGFTAVDVLALGAFGHAMGVGIVLGLKGIGAL
jgi:photosystem I subunit X